MNKRYFTRNTLEEDYPFDIDDKDQDKFFEFEQVYNDIVNQSRFSLDLV